MINLIGLLLIGLAAGWAGTRLMGAGGAGVLTMMVVGVIGSYVGPLLFSLVGFKKIVFPASLLPAVVGAVVCIAAVRYFGPKL